MEGEGVGGVSKVHFFCVCEEKVKKVKNLRDGGVA